MFTIFNTLTNKEELFIPNDATHIKMYVCGPTVYDRPHIGNARSIVFYDVLYRILNILYPKVTYVRNITDVDDKIIERARQMGISPEELTKKTISEFEEDAKSLNCLTPNHQPKATEYIAEMVKMIQTLLNEKNAYIATNGDVIFSVNSFKEYGKLSNRKLEDLQSGARVALSGFKQNDNDFVLWKKVEKAEYGFDSPFGYGRPGWHIECSAMSTSILGMNFDIHGGGADLQFPHHENEIAQSECTFKGMQFAKYWVHNGFLTVEGEKMSKSIGNFITVKNLLDAGYTGREIRFTLLNTHYRKPLGYSTHAIQTAKLAVEKFDKVYKKYEEVINTFDEKIKWEDLPKLAQDAIFSNINISKITAIMHSLINDTKNTQDEPNKNLLIKQFYSLYKLLGL